MAKQVQDLTPQVPVECGTDRFQKKIVFNSTQGQDRVLHILSSKNFLKLLYQQLLHQLQNSLQQYNIYKNSEKSNEDGNIFRSNWNFETNSRGQGMYWNYMPNNNKGKQQV